MKKLMQVCITGFAILFLGLALMIPTTVLAGNATNDEILLNSDVFAVNGHTQFWRGHLVYNDATFHRAEGVFWRNKGHQRNLDALIAKMENFAKPMNPLVVAAATFRIEQRAQTFTGTNTGRLLMIVAVVPNYRTYGNADVYHFKRAGATTKILPFTQAVKMSRYAECNGCHYRHQHRG